MLDVPDLVVPAALSRRKKRSLQRREDLLRVALELAGRYGAGAVTFDLLARETQSPKSNAVQHFRSKEGLMLAIVEAAEHDFFERVVVPTSGLSAPVARIAALVDAWCADALARPGGCLLATLLHELDGAPGAPRDRLRQTVERLRHVIAVLVEDGHRRGDIAPDVSADDVFGAVLGVVLATNIGAQMGAPAAPARKTLLRFLLPA